MPYHSIKVSDRESWHRAFPLEKKIIHIGSDTRNDIRVTSRQDGQSISWRIQLIALPTSPPQYRLVNLGHTSILLGALGERTLAPRSRTNVTDGEPISVGGDSYIDITDGEHISVGGGLTLVLHCSGTISGADGVSPSSYSYAKSKSSKLYGASQNIGLKLVLPHRRLNPNGVIDGCVTVHNRGEKPGVKFNLTVEDLDTDCYKIGAGPVLFPNAEREVFFQLAHPHRSTLSAGERQFHIHATASEYPEERATVSEIVHILPFYEHELRFVDEE